MPRRHFVRHWAAITVHNIETGERFYLYPDRKATPGDRD